MTRLIDADELAKNFAVPSNELFYAGTVLEYIKDAPTVDAEPVRHGKWVDATGVLDSVRQYKCSECGKKPILNEHWCFELTKFCPFCGAKMED